MSTRTPEEPPRFRPFRGMPLEHYWPAEKLAEVFPGRFERRGSGRAADRVPASPREPSRQGSEALEGGCRLYRFPFRPRVVGALP
jgi:hypothetical protein